MNIFRNREVNDLEDKQVIYKEEKENRRFQFYNETSDFIQKMNELLAETVKQYYIVNDDHNILEKLANKVKVHNRR